MEGSLLGSEGQKRKRIWPLSPEPPVTQPSGPEGTRGRLAGSIGLCWGSAVGRLTSHLPPCRAAGKGLLGPINELPLLGAAFPWAVR